MMVKIKRVKYRGKMYVELRESNRLVERRRWHPRRFTVTDAMKQYKLTNSIRSDVIRTRLTNVVEVTDFSRRAIRSTGGRFAKNKYIIKAGARIKNKIIWASSRAGTNKEDMMEDAQTNLAYRVAEASGRGYDEQAGREILKGRKIRYATVRYLARRPRR